MDGENIEKERTSLRRISKGKSMERMVYIFKQRTIIETGKNGRIFFLKNTVMK
jgi:hypothetical protein